ncbi:hypothetical protein [Methylobacterium oxalidis]|uniref:hypothetical protein n=1 Tax=Methylobacterium oxalidis TaxID=944322 RepID=UPI003315C1A6
MTFPPHTETLVKETRAIFPNRAEVAMSPAQAQRVLSSYFAQIGVSLPLHACGRSLYDANGHSIFVGVPKDGAAIDAERAEAFARVINSMGGYEPAALPAAAE